MFYFNYSTDELIGPEEMEEAKVRCGSVAKFEKELMGGATSLKMSTGGSRVHEA